MIFSGTAFGEDSWERELAFSMANAVGRHQDIARQ